MWKTVVSGKASANGVEGRLVNRMFLKHFQKAVHNDFEMNKLNQNFFVGLNFVLRHLSCGRKATVGAFQQCCMKVG